MAATTAGANIFLDAYVLLALPPPSSVLGGDRGTNGGDSLNGIRRVLIKTSKTIVTFPFPSEVRARLCLAELQSFRRKLRGRGLALRSVVPLSKRGSRLSSKINCTCGMPNHDMVIFAF
jgi:hypothetical protein